jgi:AraC-like DNA-binding protein
MGFVWRFIGFILAASIFALGYKGILQKEVFFADVASQPTVIKKEDPAEPADQAMIGKLLEFMTTNKPYLNPELSLSSLSQELGINRNQLSQLINDGIGENFYDFVNKFRVDEVKRLMADPQKQNYNLLGIALEAGFKSKSTFNLVFKRFTGLTPTEYKKNIT